MVVPTGLLPRVLMHTASLQSLAIQRYMENQEQAQRRPAVTTDQEPPADRTKNSTIHAHAYAAQETPH